METPESETCASLHCPNCGAQAHPEEASCNYCNSPLATVSCPKCFEKMFVGMSHCPWCGTTPQREIQPDQKQLPCPRCQKPMQNLLIGSSPLRECLNCGGLWVAVEIFEKLRQTQEEQEAVLGFENMGSFIAASNGKKSVRLYIPCPVCGNMMNRTNFAGCSGVIVDWCKTHGTWFDNQELHQIVRFIQGGGLKKSREREKENLRAEQMRLRLQQQELIRQEARLGSSATPQEGWREDSDSLLEFLGNLWSTLKNR
jgi:Zn-finger nucleic acid-binding protein